MTLNRLTRTCCAALVAAVAVPAAAHGACDEPLDTVFAAYGDSALYALAPDGGFETGATGWTLTGDATVVADDANHLNRGPDAHALQLGPGAVAVSPAFCITKDFRTARMFTRLASDGRANRTLVAEVVSARGTKYMGRVAPSATWQPTAPLRMGVGMLGLRRGEHAMVQIRLSVVGNAQWQVDDLYIDPRMR